MPKKLFLLFKLSDLLTFVENICSADIETTNSQFSYDLVL